ncbi:MAG: virulence factor TspB C-terminal domain-related protein [Polaromonas sp.]|nr:virulence factor TspB C-terminal domain-related protein [Polaromonas sp.]
MDSVFKVGTSLLLALTGLMWSPFADAAYTWYTGGGTNNPGGTAQTSCTAFAQVQAASQGGSNWDGRLSAGSPSGEPTSYNCAVFTAPAPTGQYRTAASTVRSGTAPTICETLAGTKAGSDTNEVSIGSASGTVIGAAIGQTRNFCHLGCVASGKVSGGLKENNGSVLLFVQNAVWTSSVCSIETAPGGGSGGDAPGQHTEPTLCSAKKKCPGQVNGIDVCVTCSAFGEGSTTQNVVQGTGTGGTDADGNPVTPGTTTIMGETKTVCEGAKCTTTTTSTKTNPDGTTSEVAQQQEKTLDDYCKSNPRSVACVDNAFGGNCTSGFTATGDALATASAMALNKINCSLDAGTALDGIRSQMAAGTYGPELDTDARSFNEFDQTNPLGASCPSDMTFSVMSASITIPFSQACWALQALGYVAVAFTLLYSTIFVVKGF